SKKPQLHIGGWFDPYLRGTLRLYREMQAKAKTLQHLLVGPWVHIPWGRKAGSVNYGQAAISPVDSLQLRWFDYFLKEINTEIQHTSPICLFEMGTNQWRHFPQFPTPSPTAYYLTTTGLASVREDAGQLTPTLPPSRGQDTLVHDPWRPVPALGGHASYPAGSFDRTHLDCRNDVLTYTSDPLTEDFALAGEVQVEVDCYADHPSFDLCAILSQVTPDGKAYNFTQGYIRLYDATNPVKIPLQATCICLPAGYRLRLSLSAACYPAYPVNVGTDKVANEVNFIDAPIITLRVRCGSEFPAQVLLPKLSSGDQNAETKTG
ncbi:MAG: CocE/NonD family hydrolase, partial [Kamptonema sp. SIO4C4]|nr:CocE/NonD family hydrolase [Kamptonema sp. SIO4C4]